MQLLKVIAKEIKDSRRQKTIRVIVKTNKSVELSIYHTSYARSVNTSNEKKTIQVICRNG